MDDCEKQSFVSDADVQHFCYEWTIRKFKYRKHTQTLISKTFISSRNYPTKWQMVLYPQGEWRGVHNTYISLYLKYLPEDNTKVIVTCTFTIKSTNGNDYCVKAESKELGEANQTCGFQQLIDLRKLEDRAEELLPDDTLTLTCAGTVVLELSDDMQVPVPEGGLLADFRQLYNSRAGSDLTLVGPGNTIIHVHKAILSARSRVFAAMFDHEFLEGNTGQVHIEDVPIDALEGLVQFFYTDQVPKKLLDIAADLVMAAEKYEVPRLKAICENHLASTLQPDNVITTLKCAVQLNLTQLKEDCLDFVRKHIRDLKKCQSWIDEMSSCSDVIKLIVESFAK